MSLDLKVKDMTRSQGCKKKPQKHSLEIAGNLDYSQETSWPEPSPLPLAASAPLPEKLEGLVKSSQAFQKSVPISQGMNL
jgi:hypothetical protein